MRISYHGNWGRTIGIYRFQTIDSAFDRTGRLTSSTPGYVGNAQKPPSESRSRMQASRWPQDFGWPLQKKDRAANNLCKPLWASIPSTIPLCAVPGGGDGPKPRYDHRHECGATSPIGENAGSQSSSTGEENPGQGRERAPRGEMR